MYILRHILGCYHDISSPLRRPCLQDLLPDLPQSCSQPCHSYTFTISVTHDLQHGSLFATLALTTLLILGSHLNFDNGGRFEARFQIWQVGRPPRPLFLAACSSFFLFSSSFGLLPSTLPGFFSA